MPLTNEKQFQMRVSPEFLEKIDAWRRVQADLPGRSEAIRRLVDIALIAIAAPVGQKKPKKDRRAGYASSGGKARPHRTHL